jgi:hypothetical protein
MPETTSTTEIVPMEDAPSLVKLAIEQGVDVAILERLVALQERVTDRLARTDFFAALKSFQDQCPELHKSKTAKIATQGGSGYSYTYAPLDGIAKTVRPYLHQNGLSYSWTTEDSTPQMLQVVCVLRHIDGHEERAVFPVPTDTKAAMSAAQKTGAALTYGQRMSLVSVLGITATDDIDGAAEGSGEQGYISSEQVKELNDLIDATKADFKKFLAFMGVEMMGDIERRHFAKAVSALARKAVTTA